LPDHLPSDQKPASSGRIEAKNPYAHSTAPVRATRPGREARAYFCSTHQQGRSRPKTKIRPVEPNPPQGLAKVTSTGQEEHILRTDQIGPAYRAPGRQAP